MSVTGPRQRFALLYPDLVKRAKAVKKPIPDELSCYVSLKGVIEALPEETAALARGTATKQQLRLIDETAETKLAGATDEEMAEAVALFAELHAVFTD